MAVTSRPDVRRGIRHLRDPGSVQAGPPRLIDYPRSGRRGVWRWIPSWKLVAAVAGVGFAGVFFGLVAVYAKTPVPQPNPDAQYQKTIVYWAANENGSRREIGRFGDVDRHIVEGSKIPRVVKDAVIAAEDRSFYDNDGISVSGIARAAWNNVRGGSLQGGSTITQQYVKNVRLSSQERSWKRKSKEFFISVKVAKELDKEEILDNYLNTIYFGRQAYGIDAAARAYFRKNAQQLNVNEAAFLAGIINGPELYDPYDGKEPRARAQVRWNYVLDGMVEMKTLAPGERPRTFPKVQRQMRQNSLRGQRGYLMDMVYAELRKEIGLTKEQIDVLGLQVYTTFDERLVNAGVKAVRENLLDRPDVPARLQVSLASVDVQTGAVKAIYGGRDFVTGRQRNAATQDLAMAGSTFKPFTLVAALDKGVSLNTRLDGNSPKVFPRDKYPKPVRNFSNASYGYVDLTTATAKSINTAYVSLNDHIGPELTREAAIRAGIPKDPRDALGLNNNLGNVLGSVAVHPIDMASAYSTLAAGGERHQRFCVEKVVWPRGSEREKKPYRHTVTSKEVFDADVIADATHAMQQVVQRPDGSGAYARMLGRPAAGKTGTSQESQSAWFVGFTPQISTAVAMYRLSKDEKGQDPIPPFGPYRSITGGSFPVRIWTSYMQEAVAGTEVQQFPQPAWIGDTPNLVPQVIVSATPTAPGRQTMFPTSTMTMPPDGFTPTEPAEPTFPTETIVEPTDEPEPTEPTEEATPTEEPPLTPQPGRGNSGNND